MISHVIPLCAGQRTRDAVHKQAHLDRTQALVLNRLTVGQGTGANEQFHRTLNRSLKAIGGNRTLYTLTCIIDAIVYVYNGVQLQHDSVMWTDQPANCNALMAITVQAGKVRSQKESRHWTIC